MNFYSYIGVSQVGVTHTSGIQLFSHKGFADCVAGYYMIDDFVFYSDKIVPILAIYLSGKKESILMLYI